MVRAKTCTSRKENFKNLKRKRGKGSARLREKEGGKGEILFSHCIKTTGKNGGQKFFCEKKKQKRRWRQRCQPLSHPISTQSGQQPMLDDTPLTSRVRFVTSKRGQLSGWLRFYALNIVRSQLLRTCAFLQITTSRQTENMPAFGLASTFEFEIIGEHPFSIF
jgi:hypothetical protein